MLKSITGSVVKGILRTQGFEACRLYPSEQAELPPDLQFSYREAQWYRALSGVSQLSIEEARLLSELIRQTDPRRPIIEIGTLFGFSTMVMVLAKQRHQELITVDNYSWNPLGFLPDTHFATTSARLREATEQHNVRLLRMDKNEFYRTYKGQPPSLFFCDADHSYEETKADIIWARSVGASVVCGDDYEPRCDGVTRAVNDLGGPRQVAGGLFVM